MLAMSSSEEIPMSPPTSFEFLSLNPGTAAAVVFLVVSTLAYALWNYYDMGAPKSSSKLPLVPLKPGGLPLIGNIEFAGDKGPLFKNCNGEITRFKVFNKDIVVFPAYEYADELYKLEGTHIRGGNSLPTIKPLIGEESILAVHGVKAKAIRSTLLPVFRPSDLLKTSHQIQSICNPAFKELGEKESFSVGPTLESLVFTLGMMFIGIEYEDSQRQRLVDATHDLMKASLSFPIDLGKYSAYGRGVIARRDLLAVARSSVAARRKKSAADEPTNNDLLQRMLDARDANGKPLTEEMLLNTMLVFTIGSFDTTCSSMTSLIMNMCRFQDVQEKLHAHIRDVLGADSDEYHGKAEIPDEKWAAFDYVEQVIYETQRYTPPMAISSLRTTMRDFEIGGKHLIKKGTALMFDQLSPTRFEKYWPNPDKFDPDRFARSSRDYKRNVAYLNTFGGGRRMCMGGGFARLEMKIFMTLLIRDYKVELADPEAPMPNLIYPFTFLLETPLHVKLTKREK